MYPSRSGICCSLRSLALRSTATHYLGQDLSSISASMRLGMTTTSGRLLQLLSLLQARRDWPGAELAERLGVSGPHHPPRRRPAARARLPGGLAHRPGRRLPAARRDRDAAAAARRRGGDRDRRRPAHRRARLGDRHRGDRGARAGQARAGPARAPAPPRQRAGLGDDQPAGRRPDRRSPAPDRDRRRLPRRRAPALRLPAPRRRREPARGRAARRSSTSGGAGTSSPGTAGARTGARSASTAWRARPRPACASRRARCRRKDAGGVRAREHHRRPATATRRA